MARVNIVSSFYNTNLDLFRRCAESVLEQTYPSLTWIVIDDASTTTTPDEIVRAVIQQKTVKFIRLEENQGPGGARNAGFKELDEDCELVCFLDSDDFLTPTSIEDRVIALDRHWVSFGKKPVMVYGSKFTLDIRDGKNEKVLEAAAPFSQERLMRECFISSNSTMFRRDVFCEHIGALSTSVKMCEDHLLWRQLSFLGEIIKIENPIYTQVIHGANLTCTLDVLKNHAKDAFQTQAELIKWYRDYIKGSL